MPLITLLTDFGLHDHFVGVMKGVIAGIAPKTQVIDISHEVEPYHIGQARFLLSQSWPFFPKRTVHVCIVDPGVGTARRPILVEVDGHRFVGPDNGLFSDLVVREGAKVRHITSTKLFLNNISQTFHGRDVFSPVAAHLTAGVTPSKTGPLISDALRQTTSEPVRIGRRFWQGEIVHIDRFGNLITNLPASEFKEMRPKGMALKVGLRLLTTLVESYASAPDDEPFLIEGSSGNLEAAVNQGSAAKVLGVGLGAPVELELW
ncbi:SAM hydrolase/SAM-dependent halogenase family protein [Paludibaculum fermentans]|uniref:SAM-dependent chlorinase/fluorinase n=1 Tax=Paludibaculum fermentans TaxID=1473598 RepID=A0A7S7NTP8_PALFE|nr:SAM-dependent chlorinase/fluorinase [Paludibaculum fermentans]QOY89548.1 SAM-dependent chlorinase/fluorinase [Paludibaculum fermentans]